MHQINITLQYSITYKLKMNVKRVGNLVLAKSNQTDARVNNLGRGLHVTGVTVCLLVSIVYDNIILNSIVLIMVHSV